LPRPAPEEQTLSVYVLAQLKIHDRARYDRYASKFMPILVQFGGRLLVSDEAPQTLEGSWNRDKAVLIRFDDRAAAERWMNSPEYQEIAKDRLAATDAVVLMLNGL
jgi:uncharacterized protein (DUF1330 family)